jgi:apolipoprotein N-acyltransferase
VLGALQSLACVYTTAWALPVLALALGVWRLNAARPGRAAWLGWCYGTAWLTAAVWWLFISMHRYGGLPAPLAAAAVLALSAALSLYLALAAGAYARWRRGVLWGDALLFAALWLLAELARGVIFTGFPWAASGYTQVDAPIAALAPWIGVYGVGAVLAFAAALLASLPRQQPVARPTLVAAVLALLTLPGALGPPAFTTAAGSLRVALLQPNVPQDEKFAAERLAQTLGWVARQLLAARADLVLTPETAVPLLPEQLEEAAPGYWAALRAHFAVPGRAALVGLPLGSFDSGYTNSVLGLSPATAAGAAYRYDKYHLVPFGELVPTGFRWFTEMMNIPLGDFARGAAVPPSFVAGAQRVAPNICYEDLFGEELARRFADPAQAPTVLANVSNIGWFGDSIAVSQHLNISRFRTLELQRPMIRATNTGATAAIDHHGRVTARLAPASVGVLEAVVEGRQGSTPFAWWAARAGLWPLWGAALLAVLWRAGGSLGRPPPGGVGGQVGP